ncbi:prepilin peptidase [Vagococcus sp. WN89Y]|uniref:prepilin peptidase n=1 Tax=Vagococcus sp. WN89Y TaxID=3457258 RepID=UPI003FCE536A
MIALFFDHPLLLLYLVLGLGLVVGSFLNVVIFRYPLMLKQRWLAETEALSALPPMAIPTFNLVSPRSHCPHCLAPVRWFDNIPLLSWLLLRGRCRACARHISKRYPLVELGTSLSFGAAALVWGESGWSIAVMYLSALLITASLIDIDHQWLPDSLTHCTLWGGLIAAWLHISPLTLHQAVAGAIMGFLTFYSVRFLSSLFFQKEALGLGDVLLFAGIGSWTSAYFLPWVALLASACGIVFVIISRNLREPMPFGPCLSIAALAVVYYQGIYLY